MVYVDQGPISHTLSWVLPHVAQLSLPQMAECCSNIINTVKSVQFQSSLSHCTMGGNPHHHRYGKYCWVPDC